jgi:signal transduction histidine kinase
MQERNATKDIRNVLLVEDNPGDALLVRDMLGRLPERRWAVRQVDRIADALATIRASRVDVVLLDLELPDAVGGAGLLRLRESAPAVPIVVLTSFAEEAGPQLVGLGAEDYLEKSRFDAPLLDRALRYALQRHEYSERKKLLAEEKGARAAAEEEWARALLLADVGAAGASSLDWDSAIERIRGALIPRFADWVGVELVDCADESVRSRLFARSGLYEKVRESRLHDIARDPTQLEALRKLPARSLIVAPMCGAERVLGTIAFVRGPQRSAFDVKSVVLARDIAQRAASAAENARLYREARDALAARDEFLRLAAHELRTPLTALTLKLGHLMRRMEKDSIRQVEHAGDVAAALQQTERLSRLINALLDVTGIARGRIALSTENIELSALLVSVCDQLRETAERAHCYLRLEGPGQPIIGSWDRTAIECVAVNLVSNAVKFGAGQPIEIGSRSEDGFAAFSVRDHGMGIALEDLPRIFERFERAVPTRHYGGMGLGLYISKGLVEAHGGTIGVWSRLGEGACFTVTLPRNAARAAT